MPADGADKPCMFNRTVIQALVVAAAVLVVAWYLGVLDAPMRLVD